MSGHDKNKVQEQQKQKKPEPKKIEPAPQAVQPAGNAAAQDALKDAPATADDGFLSALDGAGGIGTSGPPPGPWAPDGAGPPGARADQEAAAKKEQEAAAKKEADRKQRIADVKLAASIQSELDDAVGIGAFNLKDTADAKRLLSGRTPQQMEMIRKQYKARTGRTLESDVSGQFGGKSGNQMMANVMQGMDLKDKLGHFDTSKSLLNTVNQASESEIREMVGWDEEKAKNGEAQNLDDSVLDQFKGKMSDEDLMKVRMKLFAGDPKKQREAVRDRIQSTKGWTSVDEGSAMTAFATLPMEDRQKMLRESPEILNSLDPVEKQRMREIASSESGALKARMAQATIGAGTDDDALKDIAKDAGRLNAEEKSLQAELANAKTTPERKKEIEKRIGELGGVNKVLTPERNKDGSFKQGTFFAQLDGDVKDEEVESYMKTMGVDQYEQSKQGIFNAMNNWNDDESHVRESFAKLEPKDRQKLYDEMESRLKGSGGITGDGMSQADLDKVKKFVTDDRAGMAEIRIDEADGILGQDEAKVYQAYMGLNEEERKKVAGTAVGQKARRMMDPAEQAAYDEVKGTGGLSIEKGTAAATDGWGTNDAVLDLTYERKSDEETAAIREGAVLAKTGDPSKMNPAEKAKFDLYRKSEAQIKGDMDGDEAQQYLDKLVGHNGEYANHYTGKTEGGTSAKKELESESGRITGTKLGNIRAEEKMGPDGDGGGGLASIFSDTDQTAIDSFQTQLSAHDMALADGSVDKGEYKDHQTKKTTFDEDFQTMVDTENKITNGIATGVAVTAGVLATAASGGLLGPAAAAAVANLGTLGTAVATGAATMGTKELFGGDRYDITGEEGQTDAAMTVLDAGIGKVIDGSTAKLLGGADEALEGATLAQKMPGILKENAVKTGMQVGTDTVKDTVTNESLYEGDLTNAMNIVGDSGVKALQSAPKNFIEGTIQDGVETHGKATRPDNQPVKHDGPLGTEYYTRGPGAETPRGEIVETHSKLPDAPSTKVEPAAPKVETGPKTEAVDALNRLPKDSAREQLQAIDGIGPALSEKVANELQNGGFENAADLAKRVKGVGPKRAQQILDGLNAD